jgi:phage portal protein BeeE
MARTYEAPDMAAFLDRTLRAMVRRAAEGDQEVLQALAHVQGTLAQAMTDSAQALHGRGHSWDFIARELGVTRQAAHKRFQLTPDP